MVFRRTSFTFLRVILLQHLILLTRYLPSSTSQRMGRAVCAPNDVLDEWALDLNSSDTILGLRELGLQAIQI